MAKSQPERRIDRKFTPAIQATSQTVLVGSLTAHDLNGIYHNGTLNDAQAPQFLKLDGSRALTGNLSVSASVTIDGVDISAHAANVNAHHAQTHSITGSDHTITASQYQLVGATATNTVGLLTPSSNPGSAAAIVRTASNGALTIHTFTVTNNLSVGGTGSITGALSVGNGSTGSAAIGATGWEDDGSYFALMGSRTVNLGAAAVTSNDANTAYTLGRAVVSYIGHSDYASLSHRDHATTTNYGFMQGPSGETFINHATGQATYLRSNNATQISVDDDYLRMFSTLTAMQSNSYASQTTGWRIGYDGSADFRYIYTDELHAKAFIADLEQALAGGQIIAKSVAMLAVDFTAPAASGTATLQVKDLPSAANMAVFQSGDIVRLRSFSRSAGSLTIANCWGVVTSYADQSDGTQTWTFTRSAGGNAGGITAGTVINADSIVLDYGTTGNGFWEVNAIDGAYAANSPYSQIVTWTTHPAIGSAVRLRMGNLAGVSISDYGLVMGTDVSDASTTSLDFRASTGTVRLGPVGSSKPNWYWDGTDMRLRLNTTTFTKLSTSGLELFGSDGTARITLDNSGAAYVSGVLTIGTSGEIRQGTGTLGTDFTGLRLRRVSSIGRLSSYSNNNENLILDDLGIDLQADGSLVSVRARALNWWLDLTDRSGDPAMKMVGYTDANTENTFLIQSLGYSGSFQNSRIRLSANLYNGTGEKYLEVDSAGLLLSNAAVGGAWTDVSSEWATGWGDYGSGYQTVEYRKFGDVVFLRGVAHRSSGSSATILTLPSGYRPPARQIFCVRSDTGADRVDVQSSGVVSVVGTTGVDYVPLEFSFSVS